MLKSIKTFNLKIIRLIQRILITFFLFLTYIIIFGLTAFFLLITNRKILLNYHRTKDTFWVDAENYQPEIEKCLRES